MNGFVDLSLLPPPSAVEVPDFEIELAATKEELIARYPAAADVLSIEGEPLVKIAELIALSKVIVVGWINDATRANMLATSWGSNLDNLAALLGVQRLIVSPANPEAIPPVAALMEGDASLRSRTQLALEGFSTAGPTGAYLFHALSASGEVLDASVTSPSPGDVVVTVLSRIGNGAPSEALVATVAAAINDQRVRPLCDNAITQGANITPYVVTAALTMLPGPDPEVARASAEAALRAYVAEAHRLGRAVRRSGLYRALHIPGAVESVTLTSPAADILCAPTHAPWCSAVTVTITEAPA